MQTLISAQKKNANFNMVHRMLESEKEANYN